MILPTKKEFQDIVYAHHNVVNAQMTMPWREDCNPYYVFLSEFMLQQTQVTRVISYFNAFISLWPTLPLLAQATLSDILFHWQGLGYNRRAKYLHESAKIITHTYDAVIPNDEAILTSLPGIGTYTAAAILVFAYNMPSIVVETNIRRVIIHHFFSDDVQVEERRVREKVTEVLDTENPRRWYWALMDYGRLLGQMYYNPNTKSTVYRKQSRFEGSNRKLRGMVLKIMLGDNRIFSVQELLHAVEDMLKKKKQDAEYGENLHHKIVYSIDNLHKEGFISCEGENMYTISRH